MRTVFWVFVYFLMCVAINLILIPWLLICLILRKRFPISPLS